MKYDPRYDLSHLKTVKPEELVNLKKLGGKGHRIGVQFTVSQVED
jgi:hypothetical protein